MAPSVKLHFFAANDVNGDVLHEITDESPYFKSLRIKPERDGLGSGELVLARRVGFAGFASGTFRAEAFVRLVIPAYSSTSYYPWGFFLNKRQQTVIHVQEDGGEEFHFGGPGPKQYLARHALGIEQQTGTGANIDLENGVWRWNEHATVGRILDRIIQEDAALNNPSLPDLTYTFDNLDDSASDAWADDDIAGPGEYEIPIGTDLLKILWDLDDFVPLTSWIELGTVATPKFELNVTQGLGDDNTGSSFGAGVCLLKEAVNIADDSLETEGASLRQASHVLVEGKDGVWVQAVRPGYSPGDYTKREKISFTRTRNEAWLEAVGKRWLTRQDNGEKELTVEIVPGANDAAGEYFPAPNRVLWLSNLISLDTSADGTSQSALDITAAEDQLVTGFEMETHGAADDSSADALAKSWTVKVRLNIERAGNVQKTPDQKTSARPGGGGCRCIPLCSPGITLDVIYESHVNQLELGYIDPGTGDEIPLWNQGEGLGSAGSTQRAGIEVWYLRDHACDFLFLSTDPTHCRITTHPDGRPYYRWIDGEIACTRPPGTGKAPGDPDSSFDNIGFALTFDGEGHPDLVGTGSSAARCGHTHTLLRDAAPTADDDEAQGYPVGTQWTVVGNGTYVLVDATAGAAVWQEVSQAELLASELTTRYEPHVDYTGSVILNGRGDPVMVEVAN